MQKIFLLLCFALSSNSVFANAIGLDMRNFNPSFDNTDFVTVHASHTLERGQFNLGLFVDQAINSIVYYNNNERIPQSRTDWNDHISGMELHIAYGILENWDVGFTVPFVMDQDVDSPGNRIQYFDKGYIEFRLSTKYRLVSTDKSGIAVVLTANLPKVKNNPFTGEGSDRIYNLEMVADTYFDRTKVALNLGFRHRNTGEPIIAYPIEPINNQIVGSIGTNHPLNEKFALIGEIYGSHPLKSGRFESDRSLSVAEALLGVNYYPRKGLALHTGMTTELFDGLFTPDWRFFAGVNWTFPVRKPGDPEPPPLEPEYEKITINHIPFKINSDQFASNSNAKKYIADVARALKQPPPFNKIIIGGHTCDLGSDSYNQNLSQRRANRIRMILINDFKLDPAKIEAVGYGESQPVVENSSETNREKNRRVEFKIFRDENK